MVANPQLPPVIGTGDTLHVEIPYCPNPYQEDFHLSNKRFRVIAGGRRVGKSFSALQELMVHCVTRPRSLAWWVSPTYRDAREVGWEMFLEYQHVFQPVIQKINHSNLTVTFINKSKLLFKGSDNENSLRGRGLTAAVLDECAFIKQDVWTKAIRPALSDRQGWAIFSSTPNGRNWYYDLYTRATAVNNSCAYKTNYEGFHWPTCLNPLITPEELEDAKEDMSLSEYRQEYEAQFVTKAGMIYDEFNEFNVIHGEEHTFHPTTHTFYLGMDFGYVNPTAITLMAIENETEWVYQLDELYLSRTPIDSIENRIHHMLAAHGLHQGNINWVYTDPAGNADELSSGISPVDFLRKKGWKVENKGTEVAPGLALVRSYVCNAKGRRRYFIHERCKETIRSMYGYCYKLGPNNIPTEEPDKDNAHDHACDAVRYFFVNRFDHAKYIFSDLNQQSYGVDITRVSRTMKRCGQCKKKFLSHTPKTRPPFMCKLCLDNKQEQLINAN